MVDQPTPDTDREQAQADPGMRGSLELHSTALQHLVEHSASLVPGTVTHRAGLDRLRGRGYPHADITIKGSTSWVTLHVAAVWPCPVEQLLTSTRDRVQEQVTHLSGTTVTEVDVVVHLINSVKTSARRVQ